ncbi:hypothetical protein ACFLU3_00920 [Chloroflexota bacterium]
MKRSSFKLGGAFALAMAMLLSLVLALPAMGNGELLTGYGGYQIPDPSIDIEKYTNGEDADNPTGPEVIVGGQILWEYIITNTGNVPLADITVNDDQGIICSCPTTTLEPGESMTCTASGVATEGQYANLGTAYGAPPEGPYVSDSDPSHYLGTVREPELPDVDVTKDDVLYADTDGNGKADPGDFVRYTVVITNNGSGDALDVVFDDTPDANTTLHSGPGYMSTSQGTITSGTGVGDTSVSVDVGTIASGGSATIIFDVMVNWDFPIEVSEVCNQGVVSGSNFTSVNTDDPDTGAVDDPTCMPVPAANTPPDVQNDQANTQCFDESGAAIQDVTITATDIDSPGEALSVVTVWHTINYGPDQAGLPSDLNLTQVTASTVSGPPGSAEWVVSGNINEPNGDYDIYIEITDGSDSDTTTFCICIY